MEQAPFALKASECSSTMHHFDGLYLASFLVNRGDFMNPVNRRPLCRAECVALDKHVKRHHPNDVCVSVTDAFNMAQRRAGHDTEAAREGDSVFQHIFHYPSGRRTDEHGHAVAYAHGSLVVVDDHDIPFQEQSPPAVMEDNFPALGPGQEASRQAVWGRRSLERTNEAFPCLGATAPANWGPGVRPLPRRKAHVREASPPRLTGWDD
jgi:hypothetical protein